MQIAGPLLMAAGPILKGVAGYKAGMYNSGVLEEQAREELMVGNAEQQRVRASARAAMGRQGSYFAESGFTPGKGSALTARSEEPTSELQSLMRKSEAVLRLKRKH